MNLRRESTMNTTRLMCGIALGFLAGCAAPAERPATPAPVQSPVPAPSGAPVKTSSHLKITKIASTNDSETYTINKAGAAWAVENQDGILSELKFQDSHTAGIQILSIPPGSLAEQFGLRPNDVIRSVNGQPVTNTVTLTELRNSDALKRASALTVGIDRAGQMRALVIRSAK